MLLIKNSIIIDPLSKTQKKADILIDNGIIRRISYSITIKRAKVIDARGMWCIPGIIDMHVHTRVPGKEYAEDFSSVTKAALSGGVGSIVVMPNTKPPLDNADIIKKFLVRSQKFPLKFYFTSAITRGRKGCVLTDIKNISRYVVAFTDDGSWVEKSFLMEEALVLAKKYGRKVFSHCEWPYIRGAVNEGIVSNILGIPPIPPWLEYSAVWRDVSISVLLKVPIHIQHVSLKESLDIIEEGKKLNHQITVETCPHYFFFTEKDVLKGGANFKMNPPLRKESDRKSIISAIKNDLIDVIATDHAPHSQLEKEKGLIKAPFGVIGLETLIASSITMLYHKNKISPLKFIDKLTLNPARILGLKKTGVLKEGYFADISLIDPNKEWVVENFYSKSKNSPFCGKKLIGKNIMTIIKGKIVYENGRFFI
ncbi:MAG: dihydroorotase [Elusimicrobiota bacterium]